MVFVESVRSVVPSFHHFITSSLHHFITPLLRYSVTPLFLLVLWSLRFRARVFVRFHVLFLSLDFLLIRFH